MMTVWVKIEFFQKNGLAKDGGIYWLQKSNIVGDVVVLFFCKLCIWHCLCLFVLCVEMFWGG